MLKITFKADLHVGAPWISESDWVGFYGGSASSAKNLIVRVLQYHLKKGDLYKIVDRVDWVGDGEVNDDA